MWQNKWKQWYRECSKWPPCAWTHAPSRFHHWSVASSTTLCCSPAHVSTSCCWKMTFLIFPMYSSCSMWMRWANLQPSNVKFLQDSVCQKWLKSVHFGHSYSKNKNVSIFVWDTVYINKASRLISEQGIVFWRQIRKAHRFVRDKCLSCLQRHNGFL